MVDQSPMTGAAIGRARLLYTMLRVGDMDRSLEFYTRQLGMTLSRREDFPDGRFTLAFIGYGDEHSNAIIELTYNWGRSDYDRGSAYGHIAIEVPDVALACAKLAAAGVKVLREKPAPCHSYRRIAQRRKSSPSSKTPMAIASNSSKRITEHRRRDLQRWFTPILPASGRLRNWRVWLRFPPRVLRRDSPARWCKASSPTSAAGARASLASCCATRICRWRRSAAVLATAASPPSAVPSRLSSGCRRPPGARGCRDGARQSAAGGTAERAPAARR